MVIPSNDNVAKRIETCNDGKTTIQRLLDCDYPFHIFPADHNRN